MPTPLSPFMVLCFFFYRSARRVGWALALRAAHIPFGPSLTLGVANGTVGTRCRYSCDSLETRKKGVRRIGLSRRLLYLLALLVCEFGGWQQQQKTLSRRPVGGRGMLASHNSKEPHDIHFVHQSY